MVVVNAVATSAVVIEPRNIRYKAFDREVIFIFMNLFKKDSFSFEDSILVRNVKYLLPHFFIDKPIHTDFLVVK